MTDAGEILEYANPKDLAPGCQIGLELADSGMEEVFNCQRTECPLYRNQQDLSYWGLVNSYFEKIPGATYLQQKIYELKNRRRGAQVAVLAKVGCDFVRATHAEPVEPVEGVEEVEDVSRVVVELAEFRVRRRSRRRY